MLVTFSCDAYENTTYFNDVAQRLLSLMGHSGTIPSAIKAADVREALACLEQGIRQEKGNSKSGDGDEKEPQISLSNRALPLINLLKAAEKKNCDVMWQQG